MTGLLFLLLVHVWFIAQHSVVAVWDASAFWSNRGTLPLTLAQVLIAVLLLWAVALAIDTGAAARPSRQPFRHARVGLRLVLILFFLIYAANVHCGTRSMDAPDEGESGQKTRVEAQTSVTRRPLPSGRAINFQNSSARRE